MHSPNPNPIPSATLILVRDSAAGLQTLLLQRSQAIKFLAGYWVFPGGGIEAVDAGFNTAADKANDKLSEEIATAKRAAVRETREEAGLQVPENDLLVMSQWITPEGAPKRFSTWFFVAGINTAEADKVMVDGGEISRALWLSPLQAIELHRQQSLNILPPTYISLLALTRFTSVAQVLQHYSGKTPLFYLPKTDFTQQQVVMLYPGDAGYDTQNVLDITALHRCVQVNNAWQYINEIGVEL